MKIVALLVSLMFAASVNAQEGTVPAGEQPAEMTAPGHGHDANAAAPAPEKGKKAKKNKKGKKGKATDEAAAPAEGQ